MRKAKFYKQWLIKGDRFGGRLHGLGKDGALSKQRGLRGTKLGPANKGRRLSEAERKAIEGCLRKDGRI